MIFAKRLFNEGHTRRFVVDHVEDRGWEIRQEEDDQVVKRTWLRDWHRVEGAMMRFALEAGELEQAGWTEV